MTWALVPLSPKELTPAARGVSPAGHGVAALVTAIDEEAQSI
jgi:hypothetical protein